MFGFGKKSTMVAREDALSGRETRPFTIQPTHVVLGTPLEGPYPEGFESLYLAMGCYWGVERIFWKQPGVYVTSVGFMGGYTPHPTYNESTTGLTGHAETVKVVYDPSVTTPELLLKQFWENHDPTTANRQGNDVGTAYRSAIYFTTPGQEQAAIATRDAFQQVLTDAGHGEISTEIRSAHDAGPYYLAEDLHQGYLHKNPGGYCNHGPNGMTCPVGLLSKDGVAAQVDVLPPTS
ncbi:MAG: peptide-methionine (S)-S-oxide reductase MsrA [Actinomycetota bacterium]|nr:peptide-methionine (S)-S-oxide reductase MsrA [Actinomycetota bacterium]